MLSRDQARALCDRVLGLRRLDHLEVSLAGGETSHLRFARGAPTTSGVTRNASLSVRAILGQRAGSASGNQLDDASLAEVVRRAEANARLAPEDPELVAPLGAQDLAAGAAFDAATAAHGAVSQARGVAAALDAARTAGVVAAGFATTAAGFEARATSSGLFAHHAATSSSLTTTARTASAAGSGWAAAVDHRIGSVDHAATARVAIAKALASNQPRALPAGRYPAVLEPSCVADLAWLMLDDMDQRVTDEGRSYFSKAPLGAPLFDRSVELYSDPGDRRAPTRTWAGDGQPQVRRAWIRDGAPAALACDRFWAGKQGRAAVPGPSNLIMSGGTSSLDELVRSTRRGVLVTSLWYIRELDPQTLTFTGLTRDGVFWIEDGVIAYPVNNFRWNDSPIALFKRIEATSAPGRATGRESAGRATVVPAIRVSEMNFASVSDAV